MPDIETLESMLAQGNDNALLRFALGSAFLKFRKYPQAIEHLSRSVQFDPGYSAAWKLYGRALADNGQTELAVAVYEQGIAAAEHKGDKQAVKEMQVYLKRLRTE